ncbi:hypothetical protein Droror1_Dr00014787 [Drosera rotundifolia]
MTIVVGCEGLKVGLEDDEDLLLADRVWNAPLIRELFSPQDADLILQIQLPESSEHDRLAWFFDSKGLFTVHSAYHLELDYRLNTGSHSCASSSEIGGVGKFGRLEPWSLLWALEVPNKIKYRLWSFLHNVLPVAANLCRRHILHDEVCFRCGAAREDIPHVIFSCKHSQMVWDTTSFAKRLGKLVVATTLDLWFRMVDLLSRSELELLVVIAWCIWFQRNSSRHGTRWRKAEQIFEFVKDYLGEFYLSRSALKRGLVNKSI